MDEIKLINEQIPPIPSKNYGDRFNDFFIAKRMKFLNKFLFALVANPIIKSSQLFFEFVTLEENAYNAKKKDYTKTVKAPVKINEFKNLEGKVNKKKEKEKINKKNFQIFILIFFLFLFYNLIY